MNCTSIPGTAHSGDSANNFLGNNYARRSAKAPDQYLPEFLTPEEIKRFGKELDEYRSELFREEYLPKVRPFPKVRELFQRIHDDNKRIVLASSGKKADTKYYIDLLKIGDLIDGYVSGRRCRQFQTGARYLCRFIGKAWRHFACRRCDRRRYKIRHRSRRKSRL